LAVTGIAIASAWLGAVEDAREAVAATEKLAPGFEFLASEVALAPAWTAAAEGDVVAARASLLAGAELARTTGHRIDEAWLLHDIARLGDPASVTARLDELAAATDSLLIAARALHAQAGRRRRP